MCRRLLKSLRTFETAHPDSIQEDVPQQETPEWAQEERIKEVDSKGAVFSEGKSPERYTVAGKTLHSGAVRVSDLFKKAEDTDLSKPKEESHPIFPSITAAKRIVISAEESYNHFGKVIDGLRQGRGRTQTQDGNTAYEGNYRNDMRMDLGTYYYKSGRYWLHRPVAGKSAGRCWRVLPAGRRFHSYWPLAQRSASWHKCYF